MRPAHLVDNHSKRVAVGLAGWGIVRLEQWFRAHPTNRPRKGNGSCRQRNCVEVNRGHHETKVCKASGTVVVDENVRLFSWSVRRKMGRECLTVLTNSKRFASGLDLVYSTTFPFCIQSETMQKCWGSMETETPNKGRMFGWDSRFQHMISRQNRYV